MQWYSNHCVRGAHNWGGGGGESAGPQPLKTLETPKTKIYKTTLL